MIWVSWRRQRAQLITLLAMLVVGAGVITLLRSNMIGAINSLQLSQCVTQAVSECSTPDVVTEFMAEWLTPLNLGQAAILSLPVLIGVFIGAPLFARELEQGTHVLAFTQSVSRTRWMLSKLVVALVPSLIVLIALQYLVSWWLSTAGNLGPRAGGPFHALNFGIEHVSPVAYTLFAFALGTFVGVVSRRTLVAMSVSLGVFIVARFALAELVNRLIPTQRVEEALGKELSVHNDGSLVIASGYADASGRPVPADRAAELNQACKASSGPIGGADIQEKYLACLPKSGLTKLYADFIPQSQAWQLHLVEASIFGALAVLLLAGTAWALRRQS